MTAIKVNFEIGHEAQLKSKKTPEGFTHDWEVFVRGQEGADISHFVDKVVFHLHETFPKPRRVVKEAPFSIKESGYAGFPFPIEIYLKNKDEPKKIKFAYDFTLQQSGLLKDRYIFQNPNEEFRKKLLKGGGIPVNNIAFYTNPDQEPRNRDYFNDEKPQLLSKPKLSSENAKKHKSKEHKDDFPHKNSNFVNLFGPPIQKPPKVSPDPKKNDRNNLPKSDKKDKEKDRSNADKKIKHEHKDSKQEKIKVKEEKEKTRPDKIKSHSKEQEKSRDRASKRQSERPQSPDPVKKKCVSPVRKPLSPPPRTNAAPNVKEEYKPKIAAEYETKKVKSEEKPDIKLEKEKKRKEKKSHDKDKERKERKEHKKDGHKSKDSPKEPPKEVPKEIPKVKEVQKEKEPIKEIVKEKVKTERSLNKFSIENLKKSPPADIEERTESHKNKDKTDYEKKHKHKKKDKKRDESREKHKEERNKEKKHKHEKRDAPANVVESYDRRDTPVTKERPPPEPTSPISLDTASQCSSKSGLAKPSLVAEDINSSHSDSDVSIIPDDEESKVKVEDQSPEPLKREPTPDPEPDPEPEPEPEPQPESVVETPQPQHKEKSKKHKDKSSRKEEKRRKRKAAEEEDAENRKISKTESVVGNNDPEIGECSGSTSIETKVQDNGVSSSLGEDAEPGDISPDYMVTLRGLQQRILMIKNNEDLERVVNLIAETGRYEVTTQTFDFDLCLLDRSTVQQLIQLVGC